MQYAVHLCALMLSRITGEVPLILQGNSLTMSTTPGSPRASGQLEGATDQRRKTNLTMIVIPWQRHRERNDRGDDQTVDEQNTLSSTIQALIPISMPAHKLGNIGPGNGSSLVYFCPPRRTHPRSPVIWKK